MLAQVGGEAVGEHLDVVAGRPRRRGPRAWTRASIASGVLREKRGSPEAGDHDTGLITYARGLSGAGEGRHEGDVGMERR